MALMGMRSNKTHINLVFTKKAYHRRGIAKAIFAYLLQDVLQENPTLEALTLNSSPYGLPFYLAIGFVPLSQEQELNGIRYGSTSSPSAMPFAAVSVLRGWQ